ncbi:hypothetical protein CAF53_02565 [Sphingobium sp. LB126]|uniref:hypothetical protein n=1 Tax=Sphingobium sp. LB126 TaxID=1983755 RepID=UPI000C204726|nr:hypothetical protein [Sphingobium sp. LB126]PJG47245.1 hypothetical protein CAF53_02565 [Sphingobium sp. LB126]
MSTNLVPGARNYAVRIEYLSGTEIFAVETHILAITDRDDIRAMASGLAAESTYANDRIPDLNWSITIDPVDPDDPDTPPPGSALMPKCPVCGHHDITREGTVRWDAVNQNWYLAAIAEIELCENCGAEDKGLAQWVSIDETGHDQFLRLVAQILGEDSLPQDLTFRLLCSPLFNRLTVEQAAAEWRLSQGARA